MTFEPTKSPDGKRWICPCKAIGGTPILKATPTVDRDAGQLVINYECDKNHDRWQWVERAGDPGFWHYAGRPFVGSILESEANASR